MSGKSLCEEKENSLRRYPIFDSNDNFENGNDNGLGLEKNPRSEERG